MLCILKSVYHTKWSSLCRRTAWFIWIHFTMPSWTFWSFNILLEWAF